MTNQADQDLIEFAGKAIGKTAQVHAGGVHELVDGKWSLTNWNPIADDGDALRLVVSCFKLFGFIRVSRKLLTALASPEGRDDANAHVRRSIARVAADIGRSIK